MLEEQDKIKTKFYNYVVAAFKEGLDSVSQLIQDKKHIGTYYDWPKMSFRENGLPSFSKEFFTNGPIEYTRAFNSYFTEKKVDRLESFLNLWEFVREQEYIKKRLLHPNMLIERNNDQKFNDHTIDIFKFLVFRIPEALIDRYIHIRGNTFFEKNVFDSIYNEYITGIFEERLPLDICIPILFIKFYFNDLKLGPAIRIKKMDESFHLARAQIKAYNPDVNESVLSSATHMLVLENLFVTISNRWEINDILSNASAYPIKQINNFFASLRIVTGLETGYAQLLVSPKNWAISYKAYLPPLYGTSIRAYPNRFENFYWNKKDVPELSPNDCEKVKSIHSKLAECDENTIHIAIKRLNQCFLRDDEEDSIIDATIGLEALLSDDSRQEMTHKLATRVGALSNIPEAQLKKPYDAYQEIKNIYKYRSAIVHGSTKTEKIKEIKLDDIRRIPTSDLAVEYLRKILKILILNPIYRNPKEIDKKLLLNHL
jgi:hypothetical protein